MKVFGHVGDPDRKGNVLPPAPVFEQDHVDYLKRTFNIGQANPILVDSVDAAVRSISWTSQDQGNREVIAHIEFLIAARKAQP